ncbi:uncharacterized protein LOC117644225 [Thrips palmi]|uniref:Uncharacterized protein LOC117644225 n=1 Tax=Thrips palmi TaxID=161013 RepID=A0A6P8YQ38_THRPL|nr:uncharacterized protein LOC117644225 [Thrips palmi]
MSLLCLFLGGALVLSVLQQVQSKYINSFAGPFIVVAHTIEPCPSDGSVVLMLRPSHFYPARPFDRQTLTGQMWSKHNLTDNLLAHVDMAVRSNNQWKDNAFVFKFPNSGCSVLRDHLPDMWRIMGHVVVKNESVSWTFPHFPVMPYGRYKFRVVTRFMNKAAAIPLSCLTVDCEIIPKPTVEPKQ